MKIITIALLVGCVAVTAQTQEGNENTNRSAAGQPPIYRVTVTERTAKAISYQHRSGATKIDFSGTALMPKSHGEAKVESKKGYIEIEVEFRNMTEATQFGGEYLTYVLWAVTPEGRTSNLGEILRGGGVSSSGKLDVTTELQVFGLIVTAEPYFAVSRPSDVVVMENVVRPDTVGKIELIDAKYELLQRGEYEHLTNVLDLKVSSKMPLELYEARNAVNIARRSGAERYAADTFLKAENNLKQSEAYRARNAGSKPVTMTARQAVQIAEDSRAIAVKRQDDDLLAAERQAGADREARAVGATARAENATVRAENATARAERATASAQNAAANAQSDAARTTREAASAQLIAQAEADRLKRENDAKTATAFTEAATARMSAQAEADRLKRENDAKAAAALREAETARMSAQAEADRLKRENDANTAAAVTEAARLKAQNDLAASNAQNEADRLRRENDAQRTAAQADLDRIAREKGQLETDKAELRGQLLLQFNAILQTRDTARGLIVNMSDVLFDTAKFRLRPEAREKLAKVAGIVSGHPGLRLEVEGHTDSVGGDDYNQKLSEERGGSVRDYLVGQGMTGTSVSSKGFGKTQPVASNETASGRQQNRRVELVISGEIIGTGIGVPIAAR
jgi:outer membrane protein OmpA-like peptidoglycan-associated protein